MGMISGMTVESMMILPLDPSIAIPLNRDDSHAPLEAQQPSFGVDLPLIHLAFWKDVYLCLISPR